MAQFRDLNISLSRELSSHKFLQSRRREITREAGRRRAQTEKFADVDAVLRDIAFRSKRKDIDVIQSPSSEKPPISAQATEAAKSNHEICTSEGCSLEIQALKVVKLKLSAVNAVPKIITSNCNDCAVIDKTNSPVQESTRAIACVFPYSSDMEKLGFLENQGAICRPLPPASDYKQRLKEFDTSREQSNVTETQQLDHLLKLKAFRKNLEQQFNLRRES